MINKLRLHAGAINKISFLAVSSERNLPPVKLLLFFAAMVTAVNRNIPLDRKFMGLRGIGGKRLKIKKRFRRRVDLRLDNGFPDDLFLKSIQDLQVAERSGCFPAQRKRFMHMSQPLPKGHCRERTPT